MEQQDDNGVLLINVTKAYYNEENISQIIPSDNTPVIHIEVLNDKTFHLLNRERDITFYTIVGSNVIPL